MLGSQRHYFSLALTSSVLLTCLASMLQLVVSQPLSATELRVDKKIIIASPTARPPYILQDEQSGIELDIIRQAFASEGIKVEFQFSSRNRQLLHFQQKKADAIMTVNQHTGVGGFASDNYISYHNVAISLAKNDLRITSIDDLKHYSVVAFLNAQHVMGNTFNKMTQNNPAYLEVSPQEKQNKMLYKERVDIVIADRYVFQDLNRMIAKDIDVTASLHYHMIFSGPDYYISFHDEALKNKFNRGLKTIRASGVYKQLEQQYFVDVETK